MISVQLFEKTAYLRIPSLKRNDRVRKGIIEIIRYLHDIGENPQHSSKNVVTENKLSAQNASMLDKKKVRKLDCQQIKAVIL